MKYAGSCMLSVIETLRQVDQDIISAIALFNPTQCMDKKVRR